MGVADMDVLLDYTKETVDINPSDYYGEEEYILNPLPSEAYKLYCSYCDEMGYKPNIFVVKDVKNPSGVNFVTLKKDSSGKYREKKVEQKDNSPSGSIMYAHLPYQLD
jgi:hypothetical protein